MNASDKTPTAGHAPPHISASDLEAARLPADAERLATAIVAAQVRALFADAHGEYAPAERFALLRPSHRRWLDASLIHFEAHRLVAVDPPTGHCRFLIDEAVEALWPRWDAAMPGWCQNPNHRAYLTLIEACLRRLPEILTGALPATDVLFPDSSMHLVEGIYKHNLIADHFNWVLGDNLRAELAAKAARDERGLRLLEIGAGTGGTTAGLLPMLRGFGDLVEEYCYTDLSKAFLLHAQEVYQPQFPALRTAIFNVGKPLSLQSIEGNRYDAVIATNVLHATSDMRETVRNAKALLKRGGMLLVNELSAWSWHTHFTFGLLDGWWLYEDETLRLPGSPCLSPAQWQSLLKAERFLDIRFPAHADHGLGQLTLAARSDGVVRQRLVQPAAPAKAPLRRVAPVAAQSSPPALEVAYATTTSVPATTSLSTSASTPVAADDAALRAACALLFREMIAGALRMDVAEIETHKPLEQYGLDSILVVQLTTHFRKLFPGTRSTLFFEVQSIDGLVAYFLEHDRATVAHAASVHAATVEMDSATTRSVPARSVPAKSVSAKTKVPAVTSLSTSTSAPVMTDDAALRAACALLFREMIAGALRMDVAEIETHKPLEQYGLDSILVVQLTTHFRKLFPGTRSTLFFEVQSIDGLVAHFLEHDRETVAHAASVHAATVHAATMLASAAAALPSTHLPAPAARARGKALDRSARRRLAPRSDAPPVLPMLPAADATPSVDAPAERAVRFDVAIIGVSGRYPQAPDLESFWDNLASGRSCASEVPADRWRWQDYHDAEKGKAGKSYTRWGGFLDDIDKFDPLFFRIAPKEAKKIDPQERLFLETSYHAIENSGYTPATLAPDGKVGVFVGVMNSRYTVQPLFYSIANRISFLFDFSGPSFAVDSACSSSLTAIHVALDSLYSGMCQAAIAGAVSLIVDPQHMVELTALGMLSEGAQCRSFGRNADGFVDAEGVGAVILKPLAQALRDGDTIHAVIKGSALNTAGRTHGYTVPNPAAQAEVVSAALARADIDSADVSYLEAHGTGTALGDPIEVAGLTRAFRSSRRAADRAPGPHCAIGSLKSNIGHCESAAGIAALTKVLLQLRHRQLVPTLHADEVNDEIDFSATPFRLQRESSAWRRQVVGEGAAAREIPRIAGISSFGAGGANAHLVVQEAPAPARTYAWDGRACLLPLSARTSDQLQQKICQLLAFVQRSGAGVDLPSLAYTLQVGREAMDERIVLIAASLDDLQRQLQALSDEGRSHEARSPDARSHEARTAPQPHRGSVRKSKEFLAECRADPGFARRCEAWIAQRDDARIAEHWVRGVDIAWAGLYAGVQPGRIPLPAYPFARERHWLAPQRTPGQGQAAAARHPLLQRNTSTLRSPGFSVALTGDERFLDADSAGHRRVPALLCIEMARAAIAESCPDDVATRGLRFEDIALDDTLHIDAACELHVALLPETDDTLRFEIFSARDGVEHVHAQGRARFAAAAGADIAVADMAAADVATLAARLSRGIAANAFHARFAALGLTDSTDRRVVQRVAHTARELVLEYAVSTEPSPPGTWGVPPDLLAAVMQGAAWLCGELAPLPSAPLDWQIRDIDAVRWFGPCGTQGYLVLRCEDNMRADADASRWDVACFDALGAPVLEMRGLRLACVSGTQGTALQGANSIAAAASAPAAMVSAPVLPSAPTTMSAPHAVETPAPEAHAPEAHAAEARAPAPVSPEAGRKIAFLRTTALVMRAPAGIEKPSAVMLSATDASSTAVAVTALARPEVTLPRPEHDGAAVPEQVCVDLHALGDGVYALTVAQHAPTDVVVDQLLQALEDVQDRADARVLLVADGGTGFLSGDVASLDAAIDAGLYRALTGFPLPTIAVMQGDAGAAGFLLGALCDFMVCARESRYAFSDAVHGLHPTLAEAGLLAARFGRARANDLLYISGGQYGRALWDKGWTFPVAEREQAMPVALALAADMAAKPRESLSLLKQHMAQALAPLVERLGSEPRPQKEPEPTVEPEPKPAGEPQAALPGIAVEMLSDSVASVRLCAGDAALPVVLSRLRETLDALATCGHAAVVLRSDVSGFLPGLPLHSDEAETPQGQAQALAALVALQATLSAFPAPVIVAFEHDADGIGWLLGLSADACVHSDRGQCSADALWQHPALLRQAMPRFAHRLDDNLARQCLFGAAAVDSDALASSAGIIARGTAADVLSTALALAEETSPLRSPVLLRQWRSLGHTPASADGDSDADAGNQALAASSTGHRAASPPPQSSAIDIEVRDNGVIVVRMVDRDAKNMYSPELIHGLEAVFAHIEASDAYRAVVLTGYDTYFACGGTRESLLAIQQGTAKFTDAKVYQLPMSCKLPVIAAMQGHAIGGGWTLGMFADLCLFSAESRYISPYMQYGFTPGAGSTLIFPARLGLDLAKETLFTASEYTGSELRAKGLPHGCCPRGDILPRALALADAIAARDAGDVRALKRYFSAPLLDAVEATYARELAMHDRSFVGQGHALQGVMQHFLSDAGPAPAAQATAAAAPSVVAPPAETAAHDVPAASQAAPQDIADFLKTLLAAELQMGVDDVDEDTQFVDLGLDSITGVTWVRRINAAYGIRIEATKVYSHPTLRQFCDFVVERVALLGAARTPSVANAAKPVLHAAQPSAAEPAPSPTAVPMPMPTTTGPVATKRVATDAAATEADLSVALRQLLAQELHMPEDEIDAHRQFVDLGLDSITGVTWVRRINAAYGTRIEATKVYSHPTLAEFARFLAGLLPARPTQLSPVQPQPSSESAEHVDARLIDARPLAERMRPASPSARTLASWRGKSARRTTGAHAIAIIGMAGQFPRAGDLDAFWRNIAGGKDCIDTVPPQRWDIERYFSEDISIPGTTNSRWMGVLDDCDAFDPLFFNISPTEAESMDPQQRLMLQNCWHAIENAAIDPRSLSGSRCGVFVGCGATDYHQRSREHQYSTQGFTGAAMSILAARIAYFLNLQGPCLSIDTACSSSLVAIANACDSLVADNCDLALAGGVAVMAGPMMHVKTGQSGMLSVDGRCFAFDHRANGFVPGEGVGTLMLKRLADAERDGDMVHAVIRGWGINQDGKTNGITAPNPVSQTRLMRAVYDRFGIDPEDIQLIEAHGTGTKLGDPIEVEGLTQAFRHYTDKTGYCALGSVKGNIGHSLYAAGVAGALKLVLALKHRQLPPAASFERLNPHIDLCDSPFVVNTALKPWPENAKGGRSAVVSAFGFSGTNAHLVLEAAPTRDTRPAAQHDVASARPALIALSAKTTEQLRQRAQLLADALAAGLAARIADADAQAAPTLHDIAYTLQVGREAMEERCALVAHSLVELEARLRAFAAELLPTERLPAGMHVGSSLSRAGKLAFIGQDAELKAVLIDTCLRDGKLDKLAELWVDGVELPWAKLYPAEAGRGPRRVELPLYPFARERYWLEDDTAAVAQRAEGAAAAIHPLLHVNASTLRQQRYRSTFDGTESFLRDHRVRFREGRVEHVLPGVAYLEMAAAAIADALPDAFAEAGSGSHPAGSHSSELHSSEPHSSKPHSSKPHGRLTLSDVVWWRPIVVDGPMAVEIDLGLEDDGVIAFEIASGSGDGRVLHCQGEARFIDAAGERMADAGLLASAQRGEQWSGDEIYAAFARMGLHYGPAHRGIRAISRVGGKLVADVALPAIAGDAYRMPPGIMDSALQACVGFLPSLQALPQAPSVPFALRSLTLHAPCPSEVVVVLTPVAGSMDGSGGHAAVESCDVSIFSKDGALCIDIRGFGWRAVDGARGFDGGGMLDGTGLPDDASMLNETRMADATLMYDQASMHEASDQTEMFDETFYRELLESISRKDVSAEDAVELGLSS